MNKPTLTPKQVMNIFHDIKKTAGMLPDALEYDGWYFTLGGDGTPIAVLENNRMGDAWFTTGQEGDPVTDASEWVGAEL